MLNFIKKYFWLITLQVIILITTIANFPVGKYFIGWDALSPEFNIPLNLTRAIFPFWQENYGLGTLTGHGFAATLPHTLIISVLEILFPQWSIRSLFTFMCLFSGGVGMYFLTKYILSKINLKKEWSLQNVIPIISFISALYYLLNLGTTQIFFIQLEAFIAQYAALPWLFLTTFLALDRNKKRYYFLFFIVSFFASIQGFIPSLFTTYFVTFSILLAVYFLTKRSKKAFKKSLTVFGISLAANIYWILPVAYFQITKGSDFLSAFNNLTSTSHFLEMSSEYGNLKNVALLKSYLFDSYQLGGFILQPWISHLNFSLIPLIGYILFGMIVVGSILSLVKIRNYYTYFFSLSFVYLFSGLAINTFPFNALSNILTSISPVYEQAFRTTFTKFGVGMSFFYSVGLCFFLFLVTYYIKKYGKNFLFYVLFFATTISIIIFALPTFKGNFLYKKLQLNIPPAYFEFMDYMKTQPDGRIADFPQYCPSGWYSYNWDYFGSGFMWYGVKQPIMSRSFDVWSNNNENYYWELSQAMDQKDYEKVSGILDKYHVNWVLSDPNILGCSEKDNPTVNNELITYLKEKKNFVKEKVFTNGLKEPITLLKNPDINDNSYISLQKNVASVGPSTHWIDSDIFKNTYYTTSNNDYIYPFRSLLSKRGLYDNSGPDISVNHGVIEFKSEIPKLTDTTLRTDSYSSVEKIVPVQLSFEKNGQDSLSVNLELKLPTIKINKKAVKDLSTKRQIITIPAFDLKGLSVFINGQKIEEKNNIYSYIFLTGENNLVEVDYENQPIATWNSNTDSLFSHEVSKYFDLKFEDVTGSFDISTPIVSDNPFYGVKKVNTDEIIPIPCNESTPSNRNVFEVSTDPSNQYVRLISDKSSQCIKLQFPSLIANQAYLLSVTTKNIKGNLLKMSLSNNGSSVLTGIETGKKNSYVISYFVIPPSSASNGYELTLENSSASKSINDFYNLAFYPIPYNFIKSASFSNKNTTSKIQTLTNISVQHNSPTSYSVKTNGQQGLLILSQSYNKDWKAFEITKTGSKLFDSLREALPFIFGTPVKNHVLVNNWANGWEITDENELVIIFLPQYLQLLIIFLAIITATLLPILKITKKINRYFDKKTEELKRKIQILRKR